MMVQARAVSISVIACLSLPLNVVASGLRRLARVYVHILRLCGAGLQQATSDCKCRFLRTA